MRFIIWLKCLFCVEKIGFIFGRLQGSKVRNTHICFRNVCQIFFLVSQDCETIEMANKNWSTLLCQIKPFINESIVYCVHHVPANLKEFFFIKFRQLKCWSNPWDSASPYIAPGLLKKKKKKNLSWVFVQIQVKI